MSAEGRPSPSSEDLERARKAHAEADPTTFSELPPTHLRPTGERSEVYHRSLSTDESSTYAPLVKNPERQQLVSRILKGIINVADVVDGPDGSKYSKYLPHERIEKETSPDELSAETELIYLVFGDFDHAYYPDQGMKEREHNNLRIEGDRVSHYDFAEAELGALPHWLRDRLPTITSLDILDEKLVATEKHLVGAEGYTFLDAIVKANAKPLHRIFPYSNGTEDTQSFQDYLLRRISHARFLIRQERRSREQQEAA